MSEFKRIWNWMKAHPWQAVVVCLLVTPFCIYGGNKGPVVHEEGIKIVSSEFGADGGSIVWEVDDDRIDVGTDTFIIYAKDRQIPARTGYGNWYEIGRTKELQWSTTQFMRCKDVVYRVSVVKEVEE